ncbi:hypothetical protein BGZ95_006027 [Linnemannia exigua]|uniref:Uncharacterized protein n=1 Tax=Linnemannia exigua TaxID=604196 RepID=A0AAD4DNG5_9FUNG|nr:hypothetical protein BGZ95_006027 [Linnemannia exigua]
MKYIGSDGASARLPGATSAQLANSDPGSSSKADAKPTMTTRPDLEPPPHK